ncbi:MAG: hypothetical protein HUU35_11560 [Armatimonadetes bacterium]|nr:hypothetical protein [Armatimonadota bacterium]
MDSLVDLADVQRLIEIVQRHGLEGLTVVEDDVEVTIAAEPAAADAVLPAAVIEDAPSPYFQLKSPITGVFYRSSGPNEPPFIKEGDAVEETDVVCLIEAMKIFNEINAGIHGRVVRVTAANEQLVVTGEVLMEIEPLDGV